MDFLEIEAIEGLRWSWNSWPASKAETSSLVVPLSIMCTPLMQFSDLPLLPYDPLTCQRCGGILNPYARVDHPSRVWVCPFCYRRNHFPTSYGGIGENSLPAELFPTYSAVEYVSSGWNPNLSPKSTSIGEAFSSSAKNLNRGSSQNFYQPYADVSSPSSTRSTPNTPFGRKVSNWGSTSNISRARVHGSTGSLLSGVSGEASGVGPGFVFLVDVCTSEEELRALKRELLLVVKQLPENALVGLITFDSMVRLHDLGFTDCSRVILFHGERELSTEQVHFYIYCFYQLYIIVLDGCAIA